jgi:CBS domain-containing protein
MKTVREILRHKGSDVHSVTPDDTVYDALVLMAQKNVGAVLVLDEGQVKGILSERDYARKVILRGASSRELLVRQIMSKDVLFVGPDKTVEECMNLMTDRRVRHLPVIERGAVVGVISIGDVVKAVIADQVGLIEQLEVYIRGTY